MRLTRSASHRLKQRKKKNVSRLWGQALFRHHRQLTTFRIRRYHQARIHAEYVVLASHRQAETQLKRAA